MIADRFGAPDLSDAEVAELQQIIEETGARTQVERAIGTLLETALEALSALPLKADAVTALGEIGAFVAGRDY